MIQAVLFLAGPSRSRAEEMAHDWGRWSPLGVSIDTPRPINVYIADAGLESFLPWYDSLGKEKKDSIKNVVWCGDGDSLGKHGKELRASTAARFEGRWREHEYSGEKDFSDCAAVISLIEYDLRHADDVLKHAWIQVHGALGGRFDHELVNVLEFAASLTRMERTAAFQLGPDVALSTMPIRGSMNIGDCFSIAPLQITGATHVKISGARYSGEVQLRQPSHGLSNSATEKDVDIVPLSCASPIILMRVV